MPGLSELLAQLTGGDDEQAEKAAERIASFGEQAIPLLSGLLDSPQPDTRWWAVRALAALHADHRGITDALLRAFHDPEVEVRQAAALGLCRHPTPAAIPDLIAALEDEDRMLARLARQALVALGEKSVPALLETLENGSPAARLEAARALAAIQDPRAVAAFFRAIRDGDSALVEYWADEGLERMGIGMAFFKPG